MLTPFIFHLQGFILSLSFCPLFLSLVFFRINPRRIVLIEKKDSKRARLVVSNKSNEQHHSLEGKLSALLTRLCLLENKCYVPSRSLKRALFRLNSALIQHNLLLAMKLVKECSVLLALEMEENSLNALGPLHLGGVEFHGFVPGCNPSSIIISLLDSSLWPSHPIYEHDIKSAFETADLSLLSSVDSKKLGIPLSLDLVRAIMSSDLIVRRAIVSRKDYNKSSFAAAAIKQFPGVEFSVPIMFSSNRLIQGSPLSPLLFILFLAVTSVNSSVSFGGEVSNQLWCYGDNIYSFDPAPPDWADCYWKNPVYLGSSGKTLGLDYQFSSSGRLLVSHSYHPYANGVQKKLDQRWKLGNRNLREED